MRKYRCRDRLGRPGVRCSAAARTTRKGRRAAGLAQEPQGASASAEAPDSVREGAPASTAMAGLVPSRTTARVVPGEAYVGETVPLDIYVMFDQSGSTCACIDPPMTNNPCPDPTCRKTRLDAIREAAGAFLDDPQERGHRRRHRLLRHSADRSGELQSRRLRERRPSASGLCPDTQATSSNR